MLTPTPAAGALRLLQCGRSSEATEMFASVWVAMDGTLLQCGRSSEATEMNDSGAVVKSFRSLQCGRSSEATEIRKASCAQYLETKASMWP